MPKVPANVTKYSKKYNEEDVKRALDAIQNGLSQRDAAKRFGVPRATLYFRKSVKFNKRTLGPNPYLTLQEEKILKEWITYCQERGFPVRVQDIQESVKLFLDSNPRKNPFNENKPGRGWIKGFLKRHPDISWRTAEGVTPASSNISEADVRKWFQAISSYLEKKELQEILEDPTRIYNGDETCFYLSPKNTKVLAKKGSKNVYEIEHHQKVNITVMFTFAATGDITPPLIIYPYKRLPVDILKSVPKEWGIGLTDNGWMDNKNFYEYIGNVFKPYLIKNQIKTPVIVFVDGHKTHLTVQTSQLCADSGIILIALYPNATRLMQPADVAAFRPLKVYWRETVLKFKRENPKKILTKAEFAPILKETVAMLRREVVKSGFRACGLYPWNPSALDYSKCLGKSHNEEVVPGDNNIETYTNNISFERFKSLAGPTKILELKNADEDTDVTDDFRILRAIYNEFTTTKSVFNNNSPRNPDDTNIDEQEQAAILLQNNAQIEDVDFFPTIDMDVDINQIPIIVCDANEILPINNVEVQKGAKENIELENVSCNININEEYVSHYDIRTISPSIENNKSSDHENETAENDTLKTSLFTSTTSTSEELLKSYLVWPETPERKGKKNSEKLPFVLTSSDRQKLEQQKIEKKTEEERLKKERQKERLKKKEEKEQNAKVQKRYQTKYRKNTKTTCQSSYKIEFKSNENITEKENNTSKQTIEMNSIILKKGLKVHLPSNKATTALKISPKQNQMTSPFLDAKIDLVKKELFQKDNNEKINIISDLLIAPSLSGLDFKNKATTDGICYDCTYNITAKKAGIKCKSCTRTYHSECARKKSNMDTYYCKTCQL